MERTFVEVGHRVETQPESRQISDVTRMAAGAERSWESLQAGRTSSLSIRDRGPWVP